MKFLKTTFGMSAVFFLLAAFTASAADWTAGDSADSARNSSEKIALFNGKNLDGWTVFIAGHEPNDDPDGVFTVSDGAIHVSGQSWGGVTCEGDFSNYRLSLEFKWGEKTWGPRKDRARDSGVLIHAYGPDGGFGAWRKSVEANIIEGGVGDFWMVTGAEDGVAATCDVVERSGVKIFDPENGKPVTITANAQGCFGWLGRDPSWKDELGFCGANDLARPGEWTEMVVEARDDVMTVYVNGKLANRVYQLGITHGAIQFQSEGAEIFYRNITLEPLQ